MILLIDTQKRKKNKTPMKVNRCSLSGKEGNIFLCLIRRS